MKCIPQTGTFFLDKTFKAEIAEWAILRTDKNLTLLVCEYCITRIGRVHFWKEISLDR